MAGRDFYDTLGVPRTASQDEIKRAFRQLAREHHPDVNQDPQAAERFAERFKEINAAYQVLGDPERRARYDRGEADGLAGRPFGGGTAFDDIFDMFFGHQGQRGGEPGPERGSDLRVVVEVTLEDAAHGTERTISIVREETCSVCFGTGAEKGSAPESCPTCHGAGQVRYSRRTPIGQFAQIATCPQCHGAGKIIRKPCRDCRGSGRVRAQREINVKVPPGVEDGTRLRIQSEGEAGMRGGVRGDLYVDLRIAEHAVFTREGHDLHCGVSISMVQAALGAEIEAPTLDGRTTLTVQPGTQPGTVVTLRGKGMPGLRGGRGDLAVHLAVTVPRDLTKDQVKALAQFAKLRGEDIKPAKKTLLDKMRTHLA